MIVQDLLTDLAVAERNIKDVIKYSRISFSDEVSKAFIKNKVETYYDLIQVDVKEALSLRNIAVKEKLLTS